MGQTIMCTLGFFGGHGFASEKLSTFVSQLMDVASEKVFWMVPPAVLICSDGCLYFSYPAFWEKQVAFGRVLPMVAQTYSYTSCLKVSPSPPTVLLSIFCAPLVKTVFVSPK